MSKEKFLNYLIILQNIVLLTTPYILSKASNYSRNTGAAVIIVLSLLYLLISKKKIVLNKKLMIFGLGYILFTSLSFFRLGSNYNKEQLNAYKGIIIYLLIGFSITQIEIDKKVYRWTPILLSIFSLFPALRALKEWHVNGFSMNYRIFGDSWPSVFCVELGILVLASIVVIFFEKSWFFKIISFFLLVISFVALIGVQARIIILLIPAFFILTAVIKNYKLGIKILTVLAVGFFIIIASTDFERYFKRFDSKDSGGSYSNLIRVEIYKRSSELIKKNWLTGIGFFNLRNINVKDDPKLIPYVDKESFGLEKEIPGTMENLKLWSHSATHSHNNILETFVTQGIIGLIFYLLFLVSIFKELLVNFRNKALGDYKEIFWLGIIMLLLVFLDGMIDTNIYMLKVNQTLFFILGMCLNKKFQGRKIRDGGQVAEYEG